MALLLIAGIDTTWSAIGAVAVAPGQDSGRPRAAGRRARRCCRPRWRSSCAPTRRSPWPGWSSRTCSWHGVDMKADDWVLLSFPAANRDPAQFDRADEVVIDREVNRHAAFGLGIHRCVGLAPGPDGAAGRARGLAGADPGVLPGRPGRGDLGRRPGPRPAHAARCGSADAGGPGLCGRARPLQAAKRAAAGPERSPGGRSRSRAPSAGGGRGRAAARRRRRPSRGRRPRAGRRSGRGRSASAQRARSPWSRTTRRAGSLTGCSMPSGIVMSRPWTTSCVSAPSRPPPGGFHGVVLVGPPAVEQRADRRLGVPAGDPVGHAREVAPGADQLAEEPRGASSGRAWSCARRPPAPASPRTATGRSSRPRAGLRARRRTRAVRR